MSAIYVAIVRTVDPEKFHVITNDKYSVMSFASEERGLAS
jgi:hypothetical protein